MGSFRHSPKFDNNVDLVIGQRPATVTPTGLDRPPQFPGKLTHSLSSRVLGRLSTLLRRQRAVLVAGA